MSEERLKRGREIQRACMGSVKRGTVRFRELAPAYVDYIDEACFGMIWDQPGLDMKTRSLVVIATLVGRDQPNEVANQTRGALNNGATREEIVQAIVQCAPYVGIPNTNHALKAALDAMEQWEIRDDWKS